MKDLKFVQLEKGNEEQFKAAESVWLPFIRELNEHDNEYEDDAQITEGLRSRIGIQGRRKDMHFEMLIVDGRVIGISMFAINPGSLYGLLEPGYGTVMGFYIVSEHRRKGYGRAFYNHIRDVLIKDGATDMFVGPDPVTGVPFWKAMGFTDSGKIDPDDKKPVYVLHNIALQPD